MIHTLHNYAIIRFLPYVDVGEFLNVGVVVHAPTTGFFDFRLVGNRQSARATKMFPELNKAVYLKAIEATKRQLQRHQNSETLFTEGRSISEHEIKAGIVAFAGLVRRAEGLVHFAEPGTIVGDSRVVVGVLFDRYVNRTFATHREYQEEQLKTRLNGMLRDWRLNGQYRKSRIVGTAEYQVRFPFVAERGDQVVRAIKPLDLTHGTPTEVYDHGAQWITRVARLGKHNALPQRVIFPVAKPEAGLERKAADEVCSDLARDGVLVLDINEADRLKAAVAVPY